MLPEASDTQAFWNNLLQARCSIAPMPSTRWDANLYVSPDPKAEDMTYSSKAAFVRDEQMETITKKRKWSGRGYNRLQAMTLEASLQALENISAEDRSKNLCGVFLGCMGADEELSVQKLLEEEQSVLSYLEQEAGPHLEDLRSATAQTFQHLRKNRTSRKEAVLATSVLATVKKELGLRGEACLVDAACASSLAALDLAIGHLRAGNCHIALAGGIEGQLAPENFVVFSQVGLLAQDLPHPLDESADGLCQGEGAVVFALQRLSDARAEGRKILGVLRASGGSSNGKASSLFSPTVNGQTTAISRSRQKSSSALFDYIECHGTGTRTGDRTELRALNEMQKGAKEKTPVGSVKALIGHTKGAAGAAGLLKCLLSLQNKTVPPSPYFTRFAESDSLSQLTVNTQPLSLADRPSPLCLGVSSAGFGGANYHMLLEEYLPQAPAVSGLPLLTTRIALIAQTQVNDPHVAEALASYKFKLPPKNLAQIDTLQLQAIVAVAHALRDFHLPLNSFDRTKVSVFSCGCTGIEASYQFSKRVRHKEFHRFASGEKAAVLEKHKAKFPAVTEDTGPGILNNVIAGRVCNVFDFMGKNFNLDADMASLGCAFEMASIELRSRSSDLVIVLQAEETFNENECEISRQGIRCYFLTLLDSARRDNRTILSLLNDVHYEETWPVQA